jgi:hypothetical protein
VRYVALAAALVCCGGSLAAQIEPGPLARAHHGLEGALQCVKCHGGGGRDQMTVRCLQCHREIAWLDEQKRGYHATLQNQACASCHPDHAGEEFALLSWPDGGPERFDHSRTGWTLTGRHATAKCADCHTAKFRHSESARRSPRQGPDWGWVGLDRTCTGCHADAHRGALDSACTTCHDTERWKPAPRFSHAQTRYPLTGAHLSVGCDACHQAARLHPPRAANGALVSVFAPVPHAECSACHADPHGGRLGGTCSTCHVTTAFTTVNRAGFDHERTRFPLRGRHASVSCERCHDFSPGGKVIRDRPFSSCGGCHDDAHAGSATLAGRVVDCAACHSVEGWRPATFTVAQHHATKFPLDGRHAAVTCAECHAKAPPGIAAAALGSAGVWLRPVAGRCRDDAHGGTLAARPDSGACESCHTVAGWAPSTVTVAAHARYRFALEGAHAAIPCVACHRGFSTAATTASPVSAPRTLAPLTFDAPARGCEGCHASPHGAQFAARADHGACEGCHDLQAFRPAARFDHARDAAFSLKGAHQAVACDRCHRTTRDAQGRPRTVYRPVPTNCEACHGDKQGRAP